MIIVWRVTERCNLSCKFCGFDRQLQRTRREADPNRLIDFGAILSDYQCRTGETVLVSWLGGEPLLWPPLALVTRAFVVDYGLKVSATTNGTTLGSPMVRAHILECYSELTVSVDAPGTLHDDLRGWPGGFAALRASVTALADEKRNTQCGPILRANVLLMRDTLPGFKQLCSELADWGIEEITFNQLGGNDRPEFYPAHRLLPEQVESLTNELPRLRSTMATTGVRLLGSERYLQRIRASSRDEQLPVRDCRPGKNFLFITESGMIAPCSFTACDYGVPMEAVLSVNDLLELPARFAGDRRRRRSPACQDCHSTHVFEKFAA